MPENVVEYSMRTDDSTLRFVGRDLTAMKAEVYRTEFPEYKMANGQIVPIDVATQFAADQQIEVEEMTPLGMNALISDYSTFGPKVSSVSRRVYYPIKTHGSHCSWSWEEALIASKRGVSLNSDRLMDTKSAYDSYVDYLGWNGDAVAGLPGLLTIPMQQATSSVPIGAASTPEAIIASLGGYVTALVDYTNGLARPKKMVMPVAKADYLFNTYRGQTDKSIGEAFLDAQTKLGRVTSIIGDNNLKGAGASGEDVMMLLPDDRKVLRYVIPMPYRVLEEARNALEYIVPTIGRISGLHCRKPMELLKVVGI